MMSFPLPPYLGGTSGLLGGVTIPRLSAQHGDLIATGGRYIETWELSVHNVSRDNYLALLNLAKEVAVKEVLRAVDGTPHTNGGAQVLFRLAEWPEGVTKSVYMIGLPYERTPFQGFGRGWDRSGRSLEIRLEEA